LYSRGAPAFIAGIVRNRGIMDLEKIGNSKHKKKFTLILYIGIFLILPIVACVTNFSPRHHVETSYIPELGDLPMPGGFKSRDDLSTSFNTPDGSITDSYIEGQGSKDEVADFYETILPEFGWKKIDLSLYEREGERLHLDISPRHKNLMIKFTLRPFEGD